MIDSSSVIEKHDSNELFLRNSLDCSVICFQPSRFHLPLETYFTEARAKIHTCSKLVKRYIWVKVGNKCCEPQPNPSSTLPNLSLIEPSAP